MLYEVFMRKDKAKQRTSSPNIKRDVEQGGTLLTINVPYKKRPLIDWYAVLSSSGIVLRATTLFTALFWPVWSPIASLVGLAVGDIGDMLANGKRRNKLRETNRRSDELDDFAAEQRKKPRNRKANVLVVDTSQLPQDWRDKIGLEPIDCTGVIFMLVNYSAQITSMILSLISYHEQQERIKAAEEAKQCTPAADNTMLYASAACTVTTLFLNRFHQHLIDRNAEAAQKQADKRLTLREKLLARNTINALKALIAVQLFNQRYRFSH